MTRALFLLLVTPLFAQQDVPLRPDTVVVRGNPIEAATYKGHKALHFSEGGGDALAVITGSSFHEGTIELDIAAAPSKGAIEGARGFAGVAFRLKDREHYEAFYLRPTNGRADDQLRRNHATQYISAPDWPWEKLRAETPGVYESYADMVPGEWTHVKVVVSGVRAELYVNGAPQPCLIVKDLKKGDSTGQLALWIGPGTDAYFANLKISAK